MITVILITHQVPWALQHPSMPSQHRRGTSSTSVGYKAPHRSTTCMSVKSGRVKHICSYLECNFAQAPRSQTTAAIHAHHARAVPARGVIAHRPAFIILADVLTKLNFKLHLQTSDIDRCLACRTCRTGRKQKGRLVIPSVIGCPYPVTGRLTSLLPMGANAT